VPKLLHSNVNFWEYLQQCPLYQYQYQYQYEYEYEYEYECIMYYYYSPFI